MSRDTSEENNELRLVSVLTYSLLERFEALAASMGRFPLRFIGRDGTFSLPAHNNLPFPSSCLSRHRTNGWEPCRIELERSLEALGQSNERNDGPIYFRCPSGSGCVLAPLRLDDCLIGGILGGPVSPDVYEATKEQMAAFIMGVRGILAEVVAHSSGYRSLAESHLRNSVLQEAALRSLRAQVNPHFLFNAMSVVAAHALLEHAPKTRRVILDLTSILRYGLRWESELVLLKEELEQVRRYVQIQQERFPDRVHLEIHCDAALMDVRVPRMGIQLLVENAIIHGIEPSGKRGTVVLNVFRNGPAIAIDVIDDGVGMDASRVYAIEEGRSPSGGSGLANLRSRLHYIYGPTAALDIVSAPGNGTAVRMSLPPASDDAVEK